MTDSDVHVLVVAAAPDTAATVNNALRDRGLLAQVDWARNAADAGDQVDRRAYGIVYGILPEMQPEALAALGSHDTLLIPTIGLAMELDDDVIEKGFKAGLTDIVSFHRPAHIAAVAKRELEVAAMRRTIEEHRAMAAAAQQEQQTLFQHSGDALAQVEDGVLVAANSAWSELFGLGRSEAGNPVLDLFDTESHGKVRDALRAASGSSVELTAVDNGGKKLPVTVAVRPMRDGIMELAIRAGRDQRQMAEEIERMQREDPETGLLNRAAFSEQAQRNADRSLVLARIDHFARVIEQMGVMGSNAVAVQFGERLKKHLQPGAKAGRIEGSLFGVILPQADKASAESWCKELSENISKATFDFAGRSTPLTVSMGIRLGNSETADAVLDEALAALRVAHSGGGNRCEIYVKPVEQLKEGEAPKEANIDWGPKLKQALVKGHFRVAFQRVASLQGSDAETNDLLLRLVDPELGEVLPGVFMPAAEKAGLMPAIDRWVIAEAIKLLKDPGQQKRGTTLFVRMSDASLTNDTTLKWMTAQIKGKIPKGQLVIELSERQTETWLRETKAMAAGVKLIGCGVMLSRFGVTADPIAVLKHLPLDYVKLDIGLLNAISKDEKRQKALRGMLEQLKENGISSVAPQVEDANAMALLWQLGVDFVQGNYLQEPEVVIADD